jgi:hypothetical protein
LLQDDLVQSQAGLGTLQTLLTTLYVNKASGRSVDS